MPNFIHLHNHTQYSLLDGANHIGSLMKKVKADGQQGVAITDHGNMFGVFEFVKEAEKNGVKPIIGCEFYMVADRRKQSFSKVKGEHDDRFHQLLLAKNRVGYENLSKLCSMGFIEGMYSKYPRIDKEILLQYKEGLIASSCCIGAEVPQLILRGKLEEAEKQLRWWVEHFGEDYYIEIQRHHGLENINQSGISQEAINQILLGWAKKYNTKVIATNDSHYLNQDDWQPHEILLCVNTGSKIDDPDRFKFPSSDFYVKTQAEMNALFSDVPEAIDNTMEIYSKIEKLKLTRDVLLPNFAVPPTFAGQTEYLKHLTYERARKKYGELTAIVTDRIDFELKVIDNMGFNGYFLIVQDFITAARDIGVWVGPGRGSAAGSAVAFALGITNIDPIKYNLLFERFLNPERVSMPDIDIDFDDEGRQRVIDYVIDKYGKNQVAQIVTFGTMAAKSSIKDVARVLNLPLADADRISKYVPTRQGVPSNLSKFMNDPLEDLRSVWSSDDMANIDKLREIYAAETPEGNVLRNAVKLEGSVRNSGIHAAGVIIAPDDITKFIPVSTAKDSDLLVTQFEGSIVEYAGMLKMDFLGLKTLTILKDAIENIVKRHGESHRIDLDTIPLDDPKAYEIFQRGDTAGIFQFESDGMAKYLRDLKPTNIEDIIAMNALYRPGPMDNIPSFVARKHGKERIDYPHEWLKPILEPTYGIMVYQEQIMQTAQIMAGYSLGQADLLRRAMGKKNKAEMEKQRTIFTKGSMDKGGVDAEKAGEIFDTMEKFASYGFNRSHAAAYSVVAYQTAYLKAHYTAEFMASVLTHNKGNTEDLNFFLQKCKEAGLPVLGPDVNESELNFTVNKKGQIRFGLSALKGVGEAPVQEILDARKKGIFFTNIFDFVKRLNLRSVNKRCLESLVLGGAFDFVTGVHRAQYFATSERFDTLIDHVLKFGKDHQDSASTAANSLFGAGAAMELAEPKMPNAPEWSLLETLNKEKEVTGIYLTGHPLDTYKTEIKNFTSCSLDGLERFKGQRVKVGVFVSNAVHKINKQGGGWGSFTLQDFVSSIELNLFREDYQKHKHLFEVGSTLYITGNYQQRWNSDEFEIKIQDVKQLAGIADTLTEAITIILPLENLTSQLIDDLDALCKNRKGKHKLKIAVIDKVNQITLPLTSKDRKVHADNDFLMDLKKMGLECRLS